MTTPLRVAIVGAGPAGIYAADILSKAGLAVSIDLFERLPAPYGLVRYGVAPDHPRIKGIITALREVLERGDIRLFGNVDFGVDITLDDLRQFYDAVIFATGAVRDAALDIPGIDLPESYGAADFVSWYDGHPDVPRTWPLTARTVAVIGNGNVALDVARMLAKHADDLLPTEIPANVYEGLAANPVTDVHVFGRRGPAQVKFTPLELRELGHLPDVDIVVYEEDFDFDEGSMEAVRSSNQTKQVVKTLTDWTLREPEELTASRRLHLHFLHRPVEVLGEGGHVVGVRTERTQLNGDGRSPAPASCTTGRCRPSTAPSATSARPWWASRSTTPAASSRNEEGRVLDLDGSRSPASTRPAGSSAARWGSSATRSPTPPRPSGTSPRTRPPGSSRRRPSATPGRSSTRSTGDGVEYTTWQGWELLDAHEQLLGQEQGRARVKVVPREEMTAISRRESD